MFRISVDTGGTFTDVVVTDRKGHSVIGKALTTHDRVWTGMREALTVAAEELQTDLAGLLGDSELLTYGTTRATNATVTGQTAKTALLVTAGFPDILVLREGGRANAHEFSRDYPEPYIPRRRTFEIPERILADGTVDRPLDEDAVRALLTRLGELGYEAIAVCLLWSVVNPAHERRIGDLIAEILPGTPATLSSTLLPIVREYRRASATAIDASLKPLMQDHLRGLERDLRAEGFGGEVMVSTIQGGIMGIDALIEAPIYTVGSGPAMAPIAAASFSAVEELGGNVIVCDTGGTTFDVGLVRDGALTYSRDSWIGEPWRGHLMGISSVDIRSRGAGGGSIAWIDDGGLLRIGPQSAGSDPGPACYGKGGIEPTVSDAACVLGYFNAEAFLGGRMKLDVAAARTAIARIAGPLGRSIERTAYDMVSIASELMIKAIHEITTTEGLNPRESAIVAGGGAAGLNIMPIARELGCDHVLLPRAASALSATGMQFADLVREETASHHTSSAAFDTDSLAATLAELDARQSAFVASLGKDASGHIRIEHHVEARYEGQVWLIDVQVPEAGVADAAGLEALIAAFHQTHERIFAISDPHSAIEFLTWKSRLIVDVPSPPQKPVPASSAAAVPAASRTCHFAGGIAHETPVFEGEALLAGQRIAGPAIVEEPTTTLVVYPGMHVTVSPFGNYILNMGNAA